MSPGDLVSVGTFPSQSNADEYALVVLAMGLECSVIESPGGQEGFEILVDQAHVDAVGQEFAAYASEQSQPIAAPLDTPAFSSGVGIALIWMMTLLIAYHFQCHDPEVTDRFSNSSRALFDQGQWWRPFTALFLHANLDHLLGNIAYGLVFFLLASHSLGPWKAWPLILGSGTIGNLLTAWIHYPSDYHSLGASTATFGALGILTGISSVTAWRLRSRHKPLLILIPATAGIILLGWLGSGEAPTDVISHLLGFLTGGIFGGIAERGHSCPHQS